MQKDFHDEPCTGKGEARTDPPENPRHPVRRLLTLPPMSAPGNVVCLLLALVTPVPAWAPPPNPAAAAHAESDRKVETLIRWLLTEGRTLDEVPFAGVVAATAGVEVLPFNAEDPVDRRIAESLSAALESLLEKINRPDHPIHRVGRINEVSGHLEELLLAVLNDRETFSCTRPPTADGRTQRAGYPDLRLVHEPSGRIFYLDPKLYASTGERSTFRTFYFEPKTETNKILDDATHLIVGIAHGGRVDGFWTFLRWKLVDLHGFNVRLKAEFQAGNRDLYRPENIIASGGARRSFPAD